MSTWNPFSKAAAMWDASRERAKLERFILEQVRVLAPNTGIEMDGDFKNQNDHLMLLWTQAAENVRRKHPEVTLQFYDTKLVITRRSFMDGVSEETAKSAKNAGLILTGGE